MAEEANLKRSEVAKILGVSGQTVDTYRKKGLLEATQYLPGGRHRYALSNVMALKKRRG